MRKSEWKGSFLYGSALLGISVILVKILGAVFKIPLAGILHETGMGYFTSAYTIYTAVYALAVSGLCTATARVTADCYAKGYRLTPVFRASMALFLVIGILGCGLSAVFCKTDRFVYGKSGYILFDYGSIARDSVLLCDGSVSWIL